MLSDLRTELRLFWNDILCATLGHPGTWVADLGRYAIARTHGIPPIGGDGVRVNGVFKPWRCTRCKMTLAEMVKEDRAVRREPDWLRKLGW